MANLNYAFGARLVGSLKGAYPKARPYVIPASDGTKTYVGDFVKSGGSADATTGYPTCIQAAAGDRLRGVVVEIIPPNNQTGSLSLEVKYRQASTRTIVMVCDDPDAIYEIQEDSGGAATALVDVGENADIVVGTANDAYGRSGMQLDSSTHVSTTAQLRILGFAARVDTDNTPASANAKLLVRINEHELTTADDAGV